MSQPRPQIYSFAHRILPLDVQREPNLWSRRPRSSATTPAP